MNTSPASAPDRGTTLCRPLLAVIALALASCASFRPPAAPALKATTWTSFDGKEMPWRVWQAPHGTKPRAVVITVHGLSGASSDFWLLGERLPPQGYIVYGYELRGQGNDPDKARHGDIGSARQWIRDLLTFQRLVRERHPGLPVIWYGESLGTLITLHAALEKEAKPDALVLATPIAGLKMPISTAQRCLLLASSRLLPGYRLKLGDLAGVDESKMRVTSTTTHGGQMAKTPHHVETFSLRLLREINSLIAGNAKAARSLQTPVLMLGSPHDVVSSERQVETLFGQLGSRDKQLRWYPKSYHLLLHDVQREEVVADLVQWLRRRG